MAQATELVRDFVKFTPEMREKYKKSGYRLLGGHSGLEICRWTKSALRGGLHCYKRWYGIASHRCIQMTPSLQFCNFRCSFCWRFHDVNRFKVEGKWDDPEFILDEAIKAQRELLTGFGGNEKTPLRMFLEAMNPKHVAISLDGEPTLYPRIVELVAEIKRRGMTAFLVTNGTMPDKLKEFLDRGIEPTNLYISVYGPDKETYQKVTNSYVPDAWERVNQSLAILCRFKTCRTIVRLTLVKEVNMHSPEKYAELIERVRPKFIECKGYTWIGDSIKRLPKEAMPTHEEMLDFAHVLAEHSGYPIRLEDKVSRIILMSKEYKHPLTLSESAR